MSRPKDAADLRLMAKISALHYLQDCTQREIAERLQLSNPKVCRLLKEARARGVVQITVTPSSSFLELESALEARYGLKEVEIVDVDPTSDGPVLRRRLGAAAAAYLQRTLSKGDTIGVSWGTTLQAMVHAVQPQTTADVHVVQVLGGVGRPEAEAHAADLSRRLAQNLSASLTLLQAPGIVGSAQVRDVLYADRHVQEALSRFDELTSLYVGIGALDTNLAHAERGAVISAGDFEELKTAGAVGDVALNFIDRHGKAVDTSLSQRLIGISLEQMKKVKRVIGVAGGPEKTEAIRAALAGELVDVLITDYDTAAGLAADVTMASA